MRVKLKNIGKIVTGKTPSTSNEKNFNGNIPFITPQDVSKGYIIHTTNRMISKKGYNSIIKNTINGVSILVNCIGNIGDVAISNQKSATNQQINAITNIKKKFDYMYIYYKLCTMKSVFQKLAGQTVLSILPKSVFDEIEIEIPDIVTQRKISNVLGRIDDKIQNNNNIILELERIAKTIYDYWFLQYEFPNEEGKPYKSSGGKMVWNEELKREIPKGWKVENLIKNSISNVILPGIEVFNQKKNYLATANVNCSNIQDGEWITYNNREDRANMQPIINSVWFAKMKNSIKHITFTKSSKPLIKKYILSTGFFGIACEDYSLSYIHSFIYSDFFEQQKDILAHGATQEAVNNQDLKNIKLTIPKKDVLIKYTNNVYNLLELQNKIINENQELTKLRDFLLPLLINGQVGFKE